MHCDRGPPAEKGGRPLPSGRLQSPIDGPFRRCVQGAVENGDCVAGEVAPVAVDGGMNQACAGRGLQAGKAGAAEAVRPIGGQRGVSAAGDRVLRDARLPARSTGRRNRNCSAGPPRQR